jgi:hypothetical protein
MVPRFAKSVLWGLGFLVVSPLFPSCGGSEQGRRCRPGWVSFGGVRTVCYPPGSLSEAVRRLPFEPVDPLGEVEKVAGVPLSHILVQTAPGPRPGPVTGITYVFGSVPGGGGIPVLSRSWPHWAVVIETDASEVEPLPTSSLTRATGIFSGETRGMRPPWTFVVGLSKRQAVLTLTSNLPKRLVHQVGSELASRDGTPS